MAVLAPACPGTVIPAYRHPLICAMCWESGDTFPRLGSLFSRQGIYVAPCAGVATLDVDLPAWSVLRQPRAGWTGKGASDAVREDEPAQGKARPAGEDAVDGPGLPGHRGGVRPPVPAAAEGGVAGSVRVEPAGDRRPDQRVPRARRP